MSVLRQAEAEGSRAYLVLVEGETHRCDTLQDVRELLCGLEEPAKVEVFARLPAVCTPLLRRSALARQAENHAVSPVEARNTKP